MKRPGHLRPGQPQGVQKRAVGSLFAPLGHFIAAHGVLLETRWREKEKAQVALRLWGTGHPAPTVTVASFRTWRDWRRCRRPVPGFNKSRCAEECIARGGRMSMLKTVADRGASGRRPFPAWRHYGSIHSRSIRRVTSQPTDRGREDCLFLKEELTEMDFISFAVLSAVLFPLKRGGQTTKECLLKRLFGTLPCGLDKRKEGRLISTG